MVSLNTPPLRHPGVPELTTLTLCPMALAGRLLLNLARTIPLLPCALVTFPQITRVLLGLPPGVTVFLHTRGDMHSYYRTAQMGGDIQLNDGVLYITFIENRLYDRYELQSDANQTSFMILTW